MTVSTAAFLLMFMVSTWVRLDRLEQAANLIPGRWHR